VNNRREKFCRSNRLQRGETRETRLSGVQALTKLRPFARAVCRWYLSAVLSDREKERNRKRERERERVRDSRNIQAWRRKRGRGMKERERERERERGEARFHAASIRKWGIPSLTKSRLTLPHRLHRFATLFRITLGFRQTRRQPHFPRLFSTRRFFYIWSRRAPGIIP